MQTIIKLFSNIYYILFLFEQEKKPLVLKEMLEKWNNVQNDFSHKNTKSTI